MENQIRLEVLIRVEPGSLGPDGKDKVEAFCTLAQRVMQQTRGKHFDWNVIPRYDKTLAEFSLRHGQRSLNSQRAEQALAYFDTTPDQLESDSMDRISNLIDRFLGHKY